MNANRYETASTTQKILKKNLCPLLKILNNKLKTVAIHHCFLYDLYQTDCVHCTHGTGTCLGDCIGSVGSVEHRLSQR